MHEVVITDACNKQLKKLKQQQPHISPKIIQALDLLRTDPHHPSLKLHKLSGRNNWSVRITGNLRLILRWDHSYLFVIQVGTHDEVY